MSATDYAWTQSIPFHVSCGACGAESMTYGYDPHAFIPCSVGCSPGAGADMAWHHAQTGGPTRDEYGMEGVDA